MKHDKQQELEKAKNGVSTRMIESILDDLEVDRKAFWKKWKERPKGRGKESWVFQKPVTSDEKEALRKIRDELWTVGQAAAYIAEKGGKNRSNHTYGVTRLLRTAIEQL